MKLSKLVLINWGTIPDGVFTFDGTTAFSGETGAGKTSILDAMIAVMTGASKKMGRLNSASDDGKGSRSRDAVYRTVESYVLGGSNGLFQRSSAHGYAAMVWEPEDEDRTHARVVSAVLAASATKREATLGSGQRRSIAEEGDVFLLTVEGAAVDLDDFVVTRQGTSVEAVTVDEIGRRLKDRYQDRKAQTSVTVHRKDELGSYLKRLYGLLEGRQEASLERAHTQAEIWSRFVAQEAIDNINEFVRRYVLPTPKDFSDLDKISLAVRASKRLKEEARSLSQRLELIEKARSAGEDYNRVSLRAKAMECALARRGYNDANEAARRAELEANQVARNLADKQATDERLEEEQRRTNGQLINVKAVLKGIPSYAQAQDLKDEIGQLEVQAPAQAATIRRGAERIREVVRRGSAMEEACSCSSHKPLVQLLRRALAIGLPAEAEADALVALAIVDDRASDAALNGIARAARPLEERVAQLADVVIAQGESLAVVAGQAMQAASDRSATIERQKRDKEEDAARIEHGNTVKHDPITRDTLEYLQKAVPEAEPAVLCDLVSDVRSEAWQPAIEGYLGGDRFTLLVKPEHESKVNVLLEERRRSGKWNQSLAQIGKLREDSRNRRAIPPDSIVHELVIERSDARDFIEFKFGDVVKVKDARDISKTRRGVTIGGRGSGGYKTFDALADEGDLTFGKRARERRLARRREEIAKLADELRKVQTEIAAVAKLQFLLETLRPVADERPSVVAAGMLEARGRIHDLRRALVHIDTSDATALEGQASMLTEQLQRIVNERTTLNREIGSLNERQNNANELKVRQSAIATQREAQRAQATDELTSLAALAPWVDREELLDEADQLAHDPNESVKSLEERRETAREQLSRHRTQFANLLSEYNLLARAEAAIAADEIYGVGQASASDTFRLIAKVVARVAELADNMRHSKLRELERQISEAADVQKDAFSLHFCHRLLDEIQRGKQTVDELNRELAHHRFGGGDTFRFDWKWVSEAFRRRHDFLVRVQEQSVDEGFNMFAEGALGAEDVTVREEILALFLAADGENGKAALMQIADYREYRVYDLVKVMDIAGKKHEQSMSLQLTDSGGEKETGLFIARVATLTGGLGLREDGPHVRTVVVDELFKKTDEQRIRTAIEYLNSLKLHVVFAMPTRAVGPFKDIIDTEYAVTRMRSDTLIGEINHFVVINHYTHNKAMIKVLKDTKIAAVRKQAAMEFDEMLAAESANEDGRTPMNVAGLAFDQ
jgi:hypothetical protein